MEKFDDDIIELELLMTSYGDYLKRTAYLYLDDIQIAEDMVQETFIKFYRKRYQFNQKASYKTYLYRILMNNCKMYVRKNKSNSLSYSDDRVTYFEDDYINKQYLTEKIKALDSKSREVIILYYYNEWRIKEISDILNITKSSVKMRLQRARKKLESQLVKEDCYEG